MANSADPDQLKPTDPDLHCLPRPGISEFSRTRVKKQTHWFREGAFYCVQVHCKAQISTFPTTVRKRIYNGK